MALSDYIPICDAVVLLMDPLVEIVIHDIGANSIAYINGGLSGRKVGDPSLLDPGDLDGVDKVVYPKINFDGRLVKSVSVIPEKNYLLCINCDVSIFDKMRELGETLLQRNNDYRPRSLLVNDWREKLHVSIHSYLQSHNLSFDYLTLRDKKAVARHLFDIGAFHEKNAADYVAKILGLGRATVFKYLKAWRN